MPSQAVCYQALTGFIQSRCGLVEYEHFGLAQQGARDGETLPLPGVLWTPMLPSINCTSERTIDRPSPVPTPIGVVVKLAPICVAVGARNPLDAPARADSQSVTAKVAPAE